MLQIITSAARHLIGASVAGYVSSGLITGDQVEQLTNGAVAVVTVVALVVWSAIEKKYLSKK